MSLNPEVLWIGAVPRSWDIVPLKFAITYNDEVLPESTDPGFELNYIEISDVSPTDGIHNCTQVPFGQAPSRARRVAQSGDVLVSTVRTYLRAIASVPDGPLISSTGFAVLRAGPMITSAYLRYLCLSGPFVESVIARSTGVSYPAINSSDLVRTRVPIPPIPAQQEISAFLDRETAKIDALIDKQEQLIATLREDRDATITQAVTKGLDPSAETRDSGIVWLGPAPTSWTAMRLKRIIKSVRSGTSVNAADTPALPNELGVLKTSCVSAGWFNPDANKTVLEEEQHRLACSVASDTLVVNRANTPDLVGASGYVRESRPNLFLSDKLWQVTFTHAMAEYVHYWTHTPVYRTQIFANSVGASSSMQNLSIFDFQNLSIALPTMSEQRSIVDFLSTRISGIEALIDKSTEMIETLSEYRSALITNAVTGKIDVREAA